MGRPSRYRLTVDARLDARRLPLLDEASFGSDGSRTVVDLPILDQSHLHGVIAMFRDQGLPLVGVERLTDGPPSREEGDRR